MTGSHGGSQPLSESDFDLSEGLGDEEENAALRQGIAAEIRATGPITFRRFMDLALYHPTDGYYSSSRERIGRSGDYVTSPEISPLFGYALARQLAEFWSCLGKPEPFTLIEPGAGNGRLARDLLRWLQASAPDCYAAVTYTLVERSRSLQAFQAELLAPFLRDGKARVQGAMPESGAGAGCVLANELLDALPVHRVVVANGRLCEIYVDVAEQGFFERLGPLSTPEIQAYFDRLRLAPAEDCVAEVCLDTRPWLAAAARVFERGYLLLLDYGYAAERKYAAWRRTGTLLCYHRHQASEDPYQFVGRQDLTAHVDFTSLELDALAAGFQLLSLTSQTRFLAGLGIGAGVHLAETGRAPLQEYYARRRAVSALLDSDGLGRVAVLLLGKDAPRCTFSGFAEAPAVAGTEP